jgi:hypothetical protein
MSALVCECTVFTERLWKSLNTREYIDKPTRPLKPLNSIGAP